MLLTVISVGVEFPLKLMKGPFEIQAITVWKWRYVNGGLERKGERVFPEGLCGGIAVHLW